MFGFFFQTTASTGYSPFMTTFTSVTRVCLYRDACSWGSIVKSSRYTPMRKSHHAARLGCEGLCASYTVQLNSIFIINDSSAKYVKHNYCVFQLPEQYRSQWTSVLRLWREELRMALQAFRRVRHKIYWLKCKWPFVLKMWSFLPLLKKSNGRHKGRNKRNVSYVGPWMHAFFTT